MKVGAPRRKPGLPSKAMQAPMNQDLLPLCSPELIAIADVAVHRNTHQAPRD